MAKKGGAQQLQTELNTDEEFERFIERPGLIVCDVYSEWCGPCLGMVGSLRKIKLELGGDNLQLVVCKADTINLLKRFAKKSEPTWLFIVDKRAINLMFGTNVPRLIKLITQELQLLNAKSSTRETYGITEMQPVELERKKIKDDAEAEANRIEEMEKDRKIRTFLMQVTDSIMENLNDIGVTIFGPQVSRDMFKKINEPAERLKLQCKDRKFTTILPENMELVNLVCSNALSEDVIEQLCKQEVLICFWKMPDDTKRSVVENIHLYCHNLTNPHSEPPEHAGGEERKFPAILAPVNIELELQLEADIVSEEEDDNDIMSDERSKDRSSDLVEKELEMAMEDGEAEADVNGEGLEIALDFDMDDILGDEEQLLEEDGMDEELQDNERTITKSILMPPVWSPNTHRGHATLVYAFFRNQTSGFLAPDPPPEPPHVIMAFDAYKKREVLELYQRHREDVPFYGFFTTDEITTTKLVAPTIELYTPKVQQPTDKIIFRVNKKTSHIMLSFATHGPTYVSADTVVGKEESLKLFPENYGIIEEPKPVDGASEKKSRKKAKVDTKEVVETKSKSEEAAAPAAALETTPEEISKDPGIESGQDETIKTDVQQQEGQEPSKDQPPPTETEATPGVEPTVEGATQAEAPTSAPTPEDATARTSARTSARKSSKSRTSAPAQAQAPPSEQTTEPTTEPAAAPAPTEPPTEPTTTPERTSTKSTAKETAPPPPPPTTDEASARTSAKSQAAAPPPDPAPELEPA